MKSASANLQLHIAERTTTMSYCAKIVRADGVIHGFTENVKDLTFDLGDGHGSITYKARGGMMRTVFRSSNDLAPDNLDLKILFDNIEVTDADLRAGLYDDAVLEVFEVNRNSLADGRIWHGKGIFGEIKITDSEYTLEFRGEEQKLTQNILEMYTADCPAHCGDGRCGLDLDPAIWTAATDYALGDHVKAAVYDGRKYICTTAGTSGGAEPAFDTVVTNTTADNTVVWTCEDAWTKHGAVQAGIVDQRTFPTDLVAAVDYYKVGVMTWLTGANAGLVQEVKAQTVGGELTLYLKAPFVIAEADTFSIVPGDDHTLETCRDRFANIASFRGFPKIPGTAALLQYPDAK